MSESSLSGKPDRSFAGIPSVDRVSIAVGPCARIDEHRLTRLVPNENYSDLERLAVERSGAVTPSVGREYPLEQAADAMRQLVAGKVHGKLAITI